MLELRGVSKRFGGVVATDDVTLDVVRGEVHALIGPNGAGKTTLIGQISGVRPTQVSIGVPGCSARYLAMARSWAVTPPWWLLCTSARERTWAPARSSRRQFRPTPWGWEGHVRRTKKIGPESAD